MSTADSLAAKKCKPCEGGTKPLQSSEVKKALENISGWSLKDSQIEKEFQFKNYYETTSFINAVIWIAHREDHHPDITFGYKKATVRYSTHAIGGISENDLICAAKINRLLF